ncbi:MAG: DNA gyrase subunit A, partial [Gammaproteobacteria bacterium]
EAIRIIREAKKNDAVREALMSHFNIDETQADYVADIKLRNLTEEHLLSRISEIEKIEKEISDMNETLNSKRLIADMIVSQLTDLKKQYGKERMTEIIELSGTNQSYSAKEEIDDFNLKLFITKGGYVKKLPLTSLRGTSTVEVKEGDEIIKEIDLTNNAELLVFTDKCNVYKTKLYEMDNHKPSSLGEYIPSMLGLKDEKILHMTATKDFSGSLLIGFSDGKVAKIDLSAYETKQNRSMLKNAYANKEVLYMEHLEKDQDINLFAVSSIDKAILLNTAFIGIKSSKTTQGVQFMKSKNDSFVKRYEKINEMTEEMEYYRNSNAGVGKYLK